MDLFEQATIVQHLEIAANRHVRDAECPHEIGNPNGSVLTDTIEDECLALPREHQ